MAQDEMGARIAIRIDELIIQLQDIPCRIEGQSAIRMHNEVHNRLVGEKIRLSFQLEKATDAK